MIYSNEKYTRIILHPGGFMWDQMTYTDLMCLQPFFFLTFFLDLRD